MRRVLVIKAEVQTMLRSSNPYVAFKSDYYRYKALLSRDRRYALIAIALIADRLLEVLF